MATELFMRPDDAEIRLNHLQQLNNEQNAAFAQLETALTQIMSGWSGATPELFNSKLENVRNRTVSAGIYNELQKYVDAFAHAIQTYRMNEEAARQKVEELESRKADAIAAGAAGASVAAYFNWQRGMTIGNPGMQRVRDIEGGRLDGLNVFRRVPDETANHNGVDLRGARGTPISAGMGLDSSVLGEGTVVFVRNDGREPGYGNLVIVEFIVDGNPFRVWFGHLDSVNVSQGQTIPANTVIGGMGDTGSGGVPGNPHLHLEVRVPPFDERVNRYVGGRYVCPEQFFGRLGSSLR